MMTELERRYKIDDHPGAIRFMAWLDEADFASFAVATASCGRTLRRPTPRRERRSPSRPPRSPTATRYGFGLNWEQEITKNVGMFSRVGWNDGHEAPWTYTDANWSASLGASIKGAEWNRPDDTVGLVGVLSGASPNRTNSSRRAARAY